MTTLSAKQKKYLKGLGHSLKSIVQIGYKGLTEAVVSQIDQALNDHELIKIKVGNNSEQGPKEMTSALTESLGCQVVQTIGGVILVYREAEEPEDRAIKLPKA